MEMTGVTSIKSNLSDLTVGDYLMLGNNKWVYTGMGTRHHADDGVSPNCYSFKCDSVADPMVFSKDEVVSFLTARMMFRLMPSLLVINDNLVTHR